MANVLIIEDEVSISKLIKLNLEMDGHSCVLVANGREALAFQVELNRFHLVILDVMLPEVSGFDICRVFRSTSNVPILFLSAKGSTTDRIAGLKLGANDYLPKPFDLEEFLLKCTILMDGINPKEDLLTLEIGGFEVDFSSFQVVNKTSDYGCELTKREVELLQMFAKHEGKVISRDDILNQLWTFEQLPSGRTIDNYILNFRKIFEKDPKNPLHFHSIRGIGYKFTS
jgi:two-component system, OmpR family, alkaline phosphatase synthesis response regulator PhoP